MKYNLKRNLFLILTFVFCFFIMQDVNAYTEKVVKCGNMDYGIPSKIATFSRNIYSLIKILVPIIIIVMGLFDFTKSVASSDVKSMDDNKNKFIRRIIAGVLVFFVLSIVNFILRAVAAPDSDSMTSCLSCFTTSESSCKLATLNDDGTSTDIIVSKKDCSDYNYTEGCPNISESGTFCKQILVSGSSTPSCVETCSYLEADKCSQRDDCEWKATSSSGNPSCHEK